MVSEELQDFRDWLDRLAEAKCKDIFSIKTGDVGNEYTGVWKKMWPYNITKR